MMLVLVLGTAFAFSSCSSDDDESDAKLLVGTWVTTKNSIHETLTIGKSGSWMWMSRGSYGTSYRKGTYTFDPESRTIIVDIQAVEGENGAYVETIFVQTLTSATLSIISDSSGSTTFRRE